MLPVMAARTCNGETFERVTGVWRDGTDTLVSGENPLGDPPKATVRTSGWTRPTGSEPDWTS